MTPALLISLLAFGSPTQARVEWSGADTCPGAEYEFERALDDYVGERALGDAFARVVVSEGDGAGMRMTLTVESVAGREQHELRGLACEQLVDQAALLVAGVIDPFVYAGGDRRMQREIVPIQRPKSVPKREPAPAPEPEPEPEPQPELEFDPPQSPSPPPPSTRDRIPRDPSRNRGSFGVAAIGFAGLFPQVGGGAQIEGGLERGAFRWQGTVTGYFGGRVRAEAANVGANLWALAGSTGLCGVPEVRRVRFPLCGVGGVGFVSAQAIGTIEPGRSVRPWVHVGAEAGVSLLARPKLSIGLGLGVHAAVVRPSWEIRAPDVDYAVPPVMGLLRVIVEIHGGRDQTTRP